MKLFTKVINGLKAVTHKAGKENASIFEIEIIASLVFYYYPGVTLMIKKTHTRKSYHTKKMTAQNLVKWVK